MIPGRSPAIDAVLFDIGGTLVDVRIDDATRRAAAEKVTAALDQLGLGQPGDGIAARLARGLREFNRAREESMREGTPRTLWLDFIWPEAAGTPAGEVLAAASEDLTYLIERYGKDKTLVPEAHAVLADLRAAGYRLGCVSNDISTRETRELLSRYTLTDWFQVVVLSSEHGVRKPDPAIFRAALSALQVAAARTVHVGDTLSRDVLGAYRTGLLGSILIRSSLTERADRGVSDVQPTFAASRLADVPALVRAWR